MSVRSTLVSARGRARGFDAGVALVVGVGLMALGLSSEFGAWIALPLTMAIVAGTVAIRRPLGGAWGWIFAGSLAWSIEELLWLFVRSTEWTQPSMLGGALHATDLPYLVGTMAWLIALLRLPHLRVPIWTLSVTPPLVLVGVLLARRPDASLAFSFPILDVLLIIASLPALEGTLRGRAVNGRLLFTLGFFVRGFTSANFAWLTASPGDDRMAPYYVLWLLGYVLIGLGAWLEMRDDERGIWPAAVVVAGLETVIFVATTSLFDTGMNAFDRGLTVATLGYVQLLGVLAILVGDRRRRLKAEDDLRRWSGLLHHLATTSASATRIERPLEGLWSEAQSLLPGLRGLTAYGDPPVVLGRDDGYAFPLVRDGAEIGHLHFASQPDGSEMLDALTPLFTQQIERMHEHASWRDQAMTDALTGLHNRRGFELELGRLLGRERDGGESLLIAIIDLDHFKRVNDVHGHPFGDSVLVLLSQLLRDHVRESDVVVRWGGEEFLVIAAGLDETRGTALFDRMRTALRAATPEPLAHPLTFSTGMVVGPIPHDPAEIFARIERADRALYQAKSAGRDRVLLAREEGVSKATTSR